ncbi:hypothetical protein MHI24_28815 [Paenibacillus sp. FSL K6-1096]|uniref:hypothetical protein n=1 Tax=Paenibacillus sp. FSL K6-1096 TaxID=2921460 RepID=UPI0030EB8CBF
MTFGNVPVKLQSLRIPSSWEVSYNTLLELNPAELGSEAGEWFNFTEDLLQLKHSNYNILLDVGWYPEADPNGKYGLELIKDYNWSTPLISFDTIDKTELVEKIELLVWQVGEGYFN